MKRIPLVAALAAPLALAACGSQPEEPTQADADPCGAARYAHLVGQVSPTITVPEGQAYRIARDGQPMTLELLQERLTFMFDRKGTLLSVSCN